MGSRGRLGLLFIAVVSSVAVVSTVEAKPPIYRASVEVKQASAASVERCNQRIAQGRPCLLQGTVFEDMNQDGRWQRTERGLPGVRVSNGHVVVLSDKHGKYELPIHEQPGGTTVFITKPAEYAAPLDQHNIPQFFYHHLPEGSPPLRFGGLRPTGPLPATINFPLVHTGSKDQSCMVKSSERCSRSRS